MVGKMHVNWDIQIQADINVQNNTNVLKEKTDHKIKL